jgi:hypothetical protein
MSQKFLKSLQNINLSTTKEIKVKSKQIKSKQVKSIDVNSYPKRVHTRNAFVYQIRFNEEFRQRLDKLYAQTDSSGVKLSLNKLVIELLDDYLIKVGL